MSIDQVTTPMDNLNLYTMRKLTTVKALNRARTKKGAAHLLGITTRNLQRWIRNYNIKRHRNNTYYMDNINTGGLAKCDS